MMMSEAIERGDICSLKKITSVVPKDRKRGQLQAINRTVAKCKLLALIVVPPSSRRVITGVMTSLTRTCLICSWVGSILRLSLATMLPEENLLFVSGKYVWKVYGAALFLADWSHARIARTPRSLPAADRSDPALSIGPNIFRSSLLCSRTLLFRHTG